ncbi:DUF397 domain-containing protein [Streptomyces sp. NPDC058657]|uniref:DUF397 domain-containing protein n=1 Tax=unclassified Streptomyces TaxID=2593676 RepID=UPI003657B0B6
MRSSARSPSRRTRTSKGTASWACTLVDGRAVRDSKNPTGPALIFPAEGRHAFVATLQGVPGR